MTAISSTLPTPPDEDPGDRYPNEPSPSELEADQGLDVDEEDGSRWSDTDEPADPCEMDGSS